MNRKTYGPGISGANVSIECCVVEADCAVCGKHFAAYTGIKKWPYRLTIDDQPPQRGGTNRMVCSWSCLCRWRREHTNEDEKSQPEEPQLILADLALPEGFILHGNTVANFDRWKLVALRADREMCRSKLRRLSGISIDCLRKLENGKALPRTETVRRLADALGVEVRELLTERKEKEDGI